MKTLVNLPTEPTGERSSSPGASEGQENLAHGLPAPVRGAANEGERRPQLSRRSIVAALAAASLPSAPALAAGGSVSPDAELIELGRRYLDLVKLEAAADEAYERSCEACHWPKKPEALRHRLEDHLGGLHFSFLKSNLPRGLSADPALNSFYVGEEVKRLQNAPTPRDPAEIPAQCARIAEIEREHEAWLEGPRSRPSGGLRCRKANGRGDRRSHAISREGDCVDPCNHARRHARSGVYRR